MWASRSAAAGVASAPVDGDADVGGGAEAASDVALVYAAALKLPLQGHQGLVVFGHHQEARGVFVEAMHDARSPLAADAQLRVAMNEGVGDGAVVVACAGVNDHAGGLVDDGEVVVVVDDHEWQVLGQQGHGFGGSDAHLHPLPTA